MRLAAQEPNRKFASWFVVALLVLMTIVAYFSALSAGFIWDDDHYVTKNPVLRDVEGLRRIWTDIGATPQYYPLVFTSFWMEYQFFRLNPLGYHLINVLLHVLNAVLLYFILHRIGARWGVFGAILFAIHPVHVESVAWITERKNVLSGAFYLAAMLAYLRFDAEDSRGKWRYYAFALSLFVCALLSKTVTATLPAAILLLIYWMRERATVRDWLRLVPFFAFGVGFGALTSWMERSEVGAEGVDWDFSIIERFLIAGRACWFYLVKLLLPVNLTFIYPRWEIDDRVWWQYLYPLAAIALIASLWLLRRRIGRGPLVAMLFFGGTLLPALGFFNVYPMRFSFVADHFQYLASIGPLCLIGAALLWLGMKAASLFTGDYEKLLARSLLFCVSIVLLAQATRKQLRIYENVEILWRDTLAKNPGAWMAHGNLAAELAQQGRTNEALQHAEVVLAARPDLPSTHVNYGDILIRAGRVADAEAAYRRALQIDAGHLKANFELGNLLINTDRTPEAIRRLQKVIERHPRFPSGHRRLAQAYEAAGAWEQSLAHYRTALELKPRMPEAMYGMARVLLMQQKTSEAIEWFRQTIALKPDFAEAYNDLATALAGEGQTSQAILSLEEAIRLKPAYRLARFNLSTLLSGEGRTQEAVAQLEMILRDHPDDAQARAVLAELVGASTRPAGEAGGG